MTVSVNISGSVTSLPTGSKVFGSSISGTGTIGTVTDLTLAAGDNTVNVPTGAIGVLIDPPSANTVVLKLKGAAGDTGVVIHPTNATLLSLGSTQTSFIVNAASLTTGTTEFSFF